VKFFAACGLLCLTALAQQRPTIGIIDTFGNRSLTPERLKKELKVIEGDPLPPSKADLEDLLIALKGVTRANVEAICCEAGKAVFYIGVEERGRAHLEIREEPKIEGLALPEDVAKVYDELIAATGEATRRGATAEDWSQGFALLEDADARAIPGAEIHVVGAVALNDAGRPRGAVRAPGDLGEIQHPALAVPVHQVGAAEGFEESLLLVGGAVGGIDVVPALEHVDFGVGVPAGKDGIVRGGRRRGSHESDREKRRKHAAV